MEKRESETGTNVTTIIRAYFHWDHKENDKPMRVRLAGLVSPTGTNLEDSEALMMVEIPVPTTNSYPVQAIASCKLTGHISICSEYYINIFTFKIKEGSGRIKFYGDFDHIYTLELAGSGIFRPLQIYFLSNFIAVMNYEKCILFRLIKLENSDISPEDSSQQNSSSSYNNKSNSSTNNKSPLLKDSSKQILLPIVPNPIVKRVNFQKVKYDPKSETVETVFLNTITKANRKLSIANTGITEEFQNEIVRGNTKLIVPNTNEDIIVQGSLKNI